jgi:phosphatidylcholine synthase
VDNRRAMVATRLEVSLPHRVAAWGVHALTALGLPLSLVAALALARADASTFFLMMVATAFIDSIDGTLARKLKVKQVVPEFDGSLLDNLIDFLTFAFLPAMALPALGLLPPGQEAWAALPLVASGYQFCQSTAKTDESFVGFPSYWNILVLYLYVLDASFAWVIGTLTALSVLVFVPIHYLYPSRTRLLRPLTIGIGSVWALMILAVSLAPEATWAEPVTWASLYFPAYYLILSGFNHHRITRAGRSG